MLRLQLPHAIVRLARWLALLLVALHLAAPISHATQPKPKSASPSSLPALSSSSFSPSSLSLALPAPSPSLSHSVLSPQPSVLVAIHPLDAIGHAVEIALSDRQLAVQARITVGPLVAARVWRSADQNNDEQIDGQEATAWGLRYLQELHLTLDGQELDLAPAPVRVTFPAQRSSFIAGTTNEILLAATLPMTEIALGQHVILLNSAFEAEISTFRYSLLQVQGLVPATPVDVTAHSATLPFAITAALPTAAATDPSQLASQIGESRLLARLRSADLSPGFLLATLLAALAFGALHALQPGHGKTLVAAYLVGSRGTVRHAIALGGIVTFTHTASVLALGGLLLAFSTTIKPERILPGLTLLSGLLVVGIGANLLRTRIMAAWRGTPSVDHDHADFSLDDHAQPGTVHSHGGRAHSHAVPQQISGRNLVALGISGGIVPCTEALVVLIVAVAVGQLVLGLLMIIAFSLGLAGVLIGIGIALVTVGSRLRGRIPQSAALIQWVPVVSATLVIILGAALAWQGVRGF